jgi:pheromone shutdown protein TraB
LSEYLGVENISNLSVEEVKAILEEKSTAAAEIETDRRRRKRMKALLLKTEKNMCSSDAPAI